MAVAASSLVEARQAGKLLALGASWSDGNVLVPEELSIEVLKGFHRDK